MTDAIVHGSSNVILLDRALVRYGPGTKEIVDQLRNLVASRMNMIWPEGSGGGEARKRMFEDRAGMEAVQDELRKLAPQTESQRQFQSQALELTDELLRERWLAIAQSEISIPNLFFGVLLFWVVALFAFIGLLASRNLTVFVAMLVCAMSISGAVFLIHEMNTPLDGMIQVSNKPMLKALSHFGK